MTTWRHADAQLLIGDDGGKAVQFLRDVADDPDLADEIDDLSVEEYQRKGFEVASDPSKRRKGTPMKAEQVKEWIGEAAKAGASEALRQNRRAHPKTVVGTV